MNDAALLPRPTIKGQSTAESPNLKSRKTTVILYEPTVFSVDLTDCNSLKDVLRTIRQRSQYSPYDVDVFIDKVKPGAIPGATWAVEDLKSVCYDWSSLHFTDLNVLPVLREHYTVQIRYLVGINDPEKPSFDVKVNSRDTVADLKEKIMGHTGFNVDLQLLDFEDRRLIDDDRLIARSIGHRSRITLTVPISLWFDSPQRTQDSWAFQHASLQLALHTFADTHQQDITALLFQIPRYSGPVASASKKWLPVRSDLFGAGEAAGTVDENGLRNGDMIKVFYLNKKTSKKRTIEQVLDQPDQVATRKALPSASAIELLHTTTY